MRPGRRGLLGAAAAAGLVLRRAAAATWWRIVTEYPATAMPGEGVSAFAEAATKLSGGALMVQADFDAPDGVRSAAMIKAVGDGRFAAADAFTGALAGEAPIFQLSALPFLTETPGDTARLLAAARPAYRAALAARKVTLLYATPWPPSGIWSRTALDAEGLRGLRIRTYDAASTTVLQGAGAAPVQLSFADAVRRLRDGSLDAVLSSGDGGAGARLWEVLPHFTVLDYASPLSLAFCNTAALEGLSEAHRAMVLDAARSTEARQFQSILTRLAVNEARMKANGVTLASVPGVRAALMAAARPVLAEWRRAAGPEGEGILAAYTAR